jgi:hypothetical protein
MKDTARLRSEPSQDLSDGGSKHEIRSGGTVLVIYNPQCFLFARQSQHGEQKIVPSRGIDPAGAKNQVAAADRLNGLLARELAPPIGI